MSIQITEMLQVELYNIFTMIFHFFFFLSTISSLWWHACGMINYQMSPRIRLEFLISSTSCGLIFAFPFPVGCWMVRCSTPVFCYTRHYLLRLFLTACINFHFVFLTFYLQRIDQLECVSVCEHAYLVPRGFNFLLVSMHHILTWVWLGNQNCWIILIPLFIVLNIFLCNIYWSF